MTTNRSNLSLAMQKIAEIIKVMDSNIEIYSISQDPEDDEIYTVTMQTGIVIRQMTFKVAYGGKVQKISSSW